MELDMELDVLDVELNMEVDVELDSISYGQRLSHNIGISFSVFVASVCKQPTRTAASEKANDIFSYFMCNMI